MSENREGEGEILIPINCAFKQVIRQLLKLPICGTQHPEAIWPDPLNTVGWGTPQPLLNHLLENGGKNASRIRAKLISPETFLDPGQNIQHLTQA